MSEPNPIVGIMRMVAQTDIDSLLIIASEKSGINCNNIIVTNEVLIIGKLRKGPWDIHKIIMTPRAHKKVRFYISHQLISSRNILKHFFNTNKSSSKLR